MAKEIGTVYQTHEREELVIEWNIQHFAGLSVKIDKKYRSPSFAFANAYWYLGVYPNGQDANESEGFIGLFLWRESSGPPISLEYTLGVESVNGKVDPVKEYTNNFLKPEGYGNPSFLERSKLLGRKYNLFRNSVSVVCKLKYPAYFKETMCSYCKTTLNADEDMSSHHQKCTEFTLKCPKCSDIVTLKNWYDHKCQTTGAKELSKPATTVCSYCKDTLDANEELSSHLQKCEFSTKCTKCGDAVALKNWHGHKCQTMGAAGLGNATTMECFFCKITLDARGNISDHMQKCTELPLKCPTCGNIFALKNWYDHKCQMTSEANEKLMNDFKSMMLRGDHSDTTIKVKHEEFRLHKNVLASRNLYFHSMFNCNMKEKNTGNVTIDDCEPDVFRSFIHFVYTGKVDKLTLENVCDLYELADKYQEDQLKSKCLHFMMSEFSVESFCDFTILALKHDEKELLEKAIKFFSRNMIEIIRSVKWQTLLTEYPIQGNELLIKAISTQSCCVHLVDKDPSHASKSKENHP